MQMLVAIAIIILKRIAKETTNDAHTLIATINDLNIRNKIGLRQTGIDGRITAEVVIVVAETVNCIINCFVYFFLTFN